MSNIAEFYTDVEQMFAIPSYDNELCYAKYGLFYANSGTLPACQPIDTYCIPRDEALVIMQEGFAYGISTIQAGEWGFVPADLKFRCTVHYQALAPVGTGNKIQSSDMVTQWTAN